jgi:hypothetical protein
MQQFEAWKPVSYVPDYLSGAFVVLASANQASVICDGQFETGKCLVLKFGRIEEVLITEEFAREWPAELAASRPGTVPLLIVRDSEWAKGSSQVATFGNALHHYCIVSADCCVDVLAPDPPSVAWAAPSAVDALFAQAEALGEA